MSVKFQHATYVGGLASDPKGGGNTLFVGDDGIGAGIFGPKHGVVAWADMAGISFDSTQIAKSRAGAALALGVGALAAKGSQDRADVVVHLKDGSAAFYQVFRASGVKVRAKITPLMQQHGVPCLDDMQPVTQATLSVGDEIAKLVALRDQGALSAEEFAAAKARLIGS